MAWVDLFDRLIEERLPDLRVERDADMKKYTSFHIGGSARRMVFPHSEADVAAVTEVCAQAGVSYYVIGKGSNLLVSDAGLDYVLINMTGMDAASLGEDFRLYAQAGALLSRIAVLAQGAGYAGLAFAHGIPGSVGGAVMMNAGAYGGEMRQVVSSVTAWLPGRGVTELRGEELAFGYRRSCFGGNGGVVLWADLELNTGDSAAIRAEMEELIRRRREKQPLEYPSAGSTFKRPEGHYAAALIDQCGLRGTAVGGAMVSPKHAGFIVNTGGATCADVLALMAQVRDTVCRETGVTLEPEVRILRRPEQ